MRETVDLVRSKDPAFQKEVETESGQNISNCYQCGNCTAGCPASPDYDMQPNQIMRWFITSPSASLAALLFSASFSL